MPRQGDVRAVQTAWMGVGRRVVVVAAAVWATVQEEVQQGVLVAWRAEAGRVEEAWAVVGRAEWKAAGAAKLACPVV